MSKPPRKPASGNKLPPWMPESMTSRGSASAKPEPARKGSGKGPAKAAGKAAAKSPPPFARPGKPPAGKGGMKRGGAPQHADPHAAREASRYEQPILSREALLVFLGDSPGPLSVDEIAEALQLTAPDRYEALSRRLTAMVRDGQLLLNRRGGYAVSAKLDLIAGTVIAHPDGFGFLRTGGGKADDLFLPPGEMRKALHGDKVLASVTGIDARGRREACIVEVLERGLSRIVGRYRETLGIGSVTPDDPRVLAELMIPAESRNGVREGQLVVCEIVEHASRGRPAIGKVLVVLGDRLTASRVVEMAIHGHNLPHEFPPATLSEAASVPVEVPAEEATRRFDLRSMPLVTIDGEDAKDFDDAVWCEPDSRGFRLVVAIADVSHYVRPGTALDDEAVQRGTSVYFPGFVVPMLPETLSNGICSLNPKVDRLCFVCDMHVDFDGQVSESKFYEAVMRSHARLTYTQVWRAVGEADTEAGQEAIKQIGSLLPNIQRLHQLYQILAKARSKRGAIEFESGEVRFVLDNKGDVTQAGMLARNDAHKLIEECMIAANVEAARFVQKKGVPAPFRVHAKPPERKYGELLEYLAEFGLRLPPWGKVEPRDYTALLKKIRERPDAALLETVLLRSQSLAVYATANEGHFGLALEAYAHFTSPIRRYPDLLLHRSIKHALLRGSEDGFGYSGDEMAAACLRCSDQERRADEAEREVDERYRSAWMAQHVGSDFDGVISGVTSFGLFVELNESKVNGMVHVTQLPHDYYHFDPVRRSLNGERKGLKFRLGDAVRVKVLKASVEDRRIDFRLVDVSESKDAPVKKPKKKDWA